MLCQDIQYPREIYIEPVISVIVPVLNEKKYIRRTLESIINQDTNISYELVVSDGGSTDGSLDIAKCFADRIIRCEEAGIGAARHFGAMNADKKSRFLVFIDADTQIPRYYIDFVYRAFRAESNLVAFSTCFEFSGNSKQIKLLERIVNNFWLIRDIVRSVTIPGFNTCVRKDAYFKCGGFRNVPLEDIDFSRRIRKTGRVRFFRNIKVLNSSRRFEKKGVMGTLSFYMQLYLKYFFSLNIKRYDGRR